MVQFGQLTDTEDHINWLAYGAEGAGKSTAIAKASAKGRVLVVNAEGGFKRKALEGQGVKVENISVFPQTPGAVVTAEDLEEIHKQVLTDLQKDPKAWYAVCLDSITEIANALREQATADRVQRTRASNPDFVDRADYGVMTNQLRKIIRRYRDLPCHVLITALEKFDEEAKERRPAITPALGADLMGYVDIVTAHKAGEPFRALTQRSDSTRAKDRFGVLPKVLAEPDFVRITGYVNGTLVEGKDPVQQKYLAAKAAQDSAKSE